MFKRRRSRTSWGFDLLEALRADRCAVCTLALRSVDRLLQGLSYESTNDPAVRDQFVRGGGFCRDHAWRYADRWRDGLSVALLYRHLLVQAQRDGQLDVGHGCLACRRRAQAERDLAAIFRDELRREDFRRAAGGAMLCQPHARLVLASGDRAAGAVALACAERGLAHREAAVAGAADLGGALAASVQRAELADALEPGPSRPRPHGPEEAPADCSACRTVVASQDGDVDWSALCNPHAWDRLASGQSPPLAAHAAQSGPRACPDCQRELSLPSSVSSRRCLNHIRLQGEPWRAATGWTASLIERLDSYIARQDYRHLAEAEGPEQRAQWDALYWTVGATRRTIIGEVLPRLGLTSQSLDKY